MRSEDTSFTAVCTRFWRRCQYKLPLLRDRYLKTDAGGWRLRVIAPAAFLIGTALTPAVTGGHNILATLQTGTVASVASAFTADALRMAAVAPAAGAAVMAPPVEPAKPVGPYLENASFKVRSGDTLSDILERASVPSMDRHKIAEELAKAGFNPRALREGQDLNVQAEVQPTGEKVFKGMEFRVSPFTRFQVASAGGSGLVAKSIETPMQDVVVSHSLPVKGSVYESMRAAGVPRQLIGNFLKPFAHHVDFQRDIQAKNKNRVEVLYDGQQTVDGAATVPGKIVYAAIVLGDRKVALYNFKTQDGDEGFFTQDGKSGKQLLMKTPIDGARLSSGFGMRKHPVLGYSKMHKGVDFAAPTGTPIYAAGDGTVEKAGPFSSYGNYIRIRHAGGYKTAYAHLSRYAQGMRDGKRVKQGEVIGYVGTTGRSTGAHLHYEVMVGGRQINPRDIKLPTGIELVAADKKRFKAEMERIDTLFKQSQSRPIDAKVQNVSF